MRNWFGIVVLVLLSSSVYAQTMKVSEDIDVRKLSDKVYGYTAWADVGKWGRVGSNGVIVVDEKKAFLFDTPMHEKQTIELVKWIDKNLGAKVIGFVAGHWHDDCVGGLAYLNKRGVKTYANKMTNRILGEKGLVQAKYDFTDSLTLQLNQLDIKCYYLGGGHAVDNIVIWLPSEKILFGGCMLKDTEAKDMGNTADAAPLTEWLQTVNAVQQKFPDAKMIIPGHGKMGGFEILEHTRKLLIDNNR